jgi:hypothetical protein
VSFLVLFFKDEKTTGKPHDNATEHTAHMHASAFLVPEWPVAEF